MQIIFLAFLPLDESGKREENGFRENGSTRLSTNRLTGLKIRSHKNKILSSFIFPHVVPSQYDALSSVDQKALIKKYTGCSI